MTTEQTEKVKLKSAWQGKWQNALDIWSPYVRLKEPVFCFTPQCEKDEGLTGSFAMIRLTDLSVVISLKQVAELGVAGFPLEVMAHEIGHHVYCPADLNDHARLTARIRRALPTMESMAGLVCNLYSDLLINDRLFREHSLRMDRVYMAVTEKTGDELWKFYMRIYEILWGVQKGTLTELPISDEMEGDAHLGNSIIRHYAHDWLKGGGRFAALCLPYILKQGGKKAHNKIRVWLDTQSPGDGTTLPVGLTGIDEDEITGAVHPALEDEEARPGEKKTSDESGGNYREPFEYGEILKSVGVHLDPREMAINYYRERAIPHLVPFPVREVPQSTDPLPEGVEVWEPGMPLERIDWIESVLRSPVVIPGITTVERVYGTARGSSPEVEPVDLDIYVDCSGSMPDPAVNISYPALAGTIITLSALRSGSRVQATLWSGKNEFKMTDGFIRNEIEIMKILTGYIGGSTAFPIHILRETYAERQAGARKVHILVISDEGVDTMMASDELNNNGVDIARAAIEQGGGGGTLVLNLYGKWKDNAGIVAAHDLGYQIYPIGDWSDLIAFSRDFARRHYQKEREK